MTLEEAQDVLDCGRVEILYFIDPEIENSRFGNVDRLQRYVARITQTS